MCKIGVYRVGLVIIYLKNAYFIFNKCIKLGTYIFVLCLKCAIRLIKYLSS